MGVPEACGVLSASLAFPEAVQDLDAGGPAQAHPLSLAEIHILLS